MTLQLKRRGAAASGAPVDAGKKADGEDQTPGNKPGQNDDDADDQAKNGKGKGKDGKDKDMASVVTPVAGDERARIKAITTGANADGFASLAAHLAFETDLSAEQAAGIIAAAMKDVSTEASASEQPVVQGNGRQAEAFRRAMNAEAPNPDLGAGGRRQGSAEEADPWFAAAAGMGLLKKAG